MSGRDILGGMAVGLLKGVEDEYQSAEKERRLMELEDYRQSQAFAYSQLAADAAVQRTVDNADVLGDAAGRQAAAQELAILNSPDLTTARRGEEAAKYRQETALGTERLNDPARQEALMRQADREAVDNIRRLQENLGPTMAYETAKEKAEFHKNLAMFGEMDEAFVGLTEEQRNDPARMALLDKALGTDVSDTILQTMNARRLSANELVTKQAYIVEGHSMARNAIFRSLTQDLDINAGTDMKDLSEEDATIVQILKDSITYQSNIAHPSTAA